VDAILNVVTEGIMPVLRRTAVRGRGSRPRAKRRVDRSTKSAMPTASMPAPETLPRAVDGTGRGSPFANGRALGHAAGGSASCNRAAVTGDQLLMTEPTEARISRSAPDALRETQKVLNEIEVRRSELVASDLIALAQVRATIALAVACDNMTDYNGCRAQRAGHGRRHPAYKVSRD
jgi:hypothetical protein